MTDSIATECTIGVGDGSGNLYVHGSYEAVKRVQSLILDAQERALDLRYLSEENERLRAKLAAIEPLAAQTITDAIDVLDSAEPFDKDCRDCLACQEPGAFNVGHADHCPCYDLQCARCGEWGTSCSMIVEEGDEWECPDCYDRLEAQQACVNDDYRVDILCANGSLWVAGDFPRWTDHGRMVTWEAFYKYELAFSDWS